MAHGDARRGMEWVASTPHTTSGRGVSSITTADAHTSADAPADLNGLVRFGERRNLVSARVPSRLKRSLLLLLVREIVRPAVSILIFVVFLRHRTEVLGWYYKWGYNRLFLNFF